MANIFPPQQLSSADLRQLLLLQGGVQGLGEALIRGDAMRRGAPVPRSQAPDPMATAMQFQQMQLAEQQRAKQQEAIAGLKTVPDDLKALMGAYPEESIRPYVAGQMRGPDQRSNYPINTPLGLVDPETFEIRLPYQQRQAPVVRNFDEGDQIFTKQWNGNGWETIASAPRWRDRAPPAAGGGGGGQLAPFMQGVPVTTIDPNTGEAVTQTQFYGATRQKGVIPSPQPVGEPIVQKREMPKQNEKFNETAGILDTAKSSLETLKSYSPGAIEKARNLAGVPSPEGAAAGSASSALLFSVAKLAEQGALQAPDKAVAEGMIGAINDPRLSESARRAKLAEFEKWLDSRTTGNQRRVPPRAGEIDTEARKLTAVKPPTPAKQAGPWQNVKTKADYDGLPSGAEFIAPDGSRRRKP